MRKPWRSPEHWDKSFVIEDRRIIRRRRGPVAIEARLILEADASDTPGLIRQEGYPLRSTFKIELKMDMPQGDDATKEIMRQALRTAAQTLLAQAIMVSNRQPQIAVTSDNNFDGPETIDVSF